MARPATRRGVKTQRGVCDGGENGRRDVFLVECWEILNVWVHCTISDHPPSVFQFSSQFFNIFSSLNFFLPLYFYTTLSRLSPFSKLLALLHLFSLRLSSFILFLWNLYTARFSSRHFKPLFFRYSSSLYPFEVLSSSLLSVRLFVRSYNILYSSPIFLSVVGIHLQRQMPTLHQPYTKLVSGQLFLLFSFIACSPFFLLSRSTSSDRCKRSAG